MRLNDLVAHFFGFGLVQFHRLFSNGNLPFKHEDLNGFFTRDFQFLLFQIAADAGLVQCKFKSNLLTLCQFTRFQFRFVDGAATRDLAALGFFLGFDAFVGQGALLGDPGFFNGLTR